MNTTPVQLALREIHTLLGSAKTWSLLLGFIALLTFSGPFGTMTLLPFAPRLLYWAVIVMSTYCTGMMVFFLNNNTPRPWWQTALLNGVLNGIFVTIILLLMNWLALKNTPFELDYALKIASYSFGVSIIIFAVLGVIDHQKPLVMQVKKPMLLKRLELNKRGALVSLSVQDHYVEVTTTKGTSLLLMRLSDAIAEADPTAGLQIHRSHWVAINQIENVRRQGDRAIVLLKTGTELPASRSNLKRLKDAGLLVR